MVATEPCILHTSAGRVRVHVPAWSGQGKRAVEQRLQRVQGVQHVQANPPTGNVLIVFDPAALSERAILQAVQELDLARINREPIEPAPPPAVREKCGKTMRARVAVRGMDRDPHVARRVVERLETRPGVRARANPLTGRVLVEFEEHEAELDDLLAEIAGIELPDLPGEDRPAYPLDPGPLVQSTTRLLGAALGLGFLAARKLLSREEALPGSETAAYGAGVLGILQGIPAVRNGLRHLCGRTVADLLVSLPGIVLNTLARSPLGLALTGLEALRLLTEVRARHAAWLRHEARVTQAPSAQPGALIRLESGERVPLSAHVREGYGTATGLDGMPLPVYPGVMIPPGARLYGGSFLLHLDNQASFEPFVPRERAVPAAPTLYDHYHRLQAPFSLLYAGLTGLLTRSVSRAFTALLLVNPRTASIGLDGAELHARARIVRAGVTVVGTRPGRALRRPGLVLLDSARLLTEKLELANALPLSDEIDAAEAIAYAAGIANAAGAPWGGIFQTGGAVAATGGSFDGTCATALIEGTRYTLEPLADWSSLPEAAALRQRGNYVLVLRKEGRETPLALFALRPRLSSGVQALVTACQRRGVELALLSRGDELVLQALARRAHVVLLKSNAALQVIAEWQQRGELVAFVADQAGAMAAFAACDLAIGVTDDRSRLPARADLLAPDLAAVAAIIEAAAEREATIRDSVGLAIVSNLAGLVWGFRGAPGIATASRVVYITAISALVDGWLRLRGGRQARSTVARLQDPQPERWGRREIAEVVRLLRTTPQGLTAKQVNERRRKAPVLRTRNALQVALLEQVRSPLTGILAAGALLSLLFGSIGDVVLIGTTIVANTLVGVWQEHKANQVAEALRHIGASQARVWRDNQEQTIPATELVPGDLLLLAAGDRIAADARIIEARGLEVDEAALTGESFPVPKVARGGSESRRIVLEGSDVTTGTGHAIVVAVGEQTRMGATRLALVEEQEQLSPLGMRLSRMLRLFLPISLAGGAAVVGAGLLWKRPLPALLATGATVALAGVPEGLPLLSRVGEAGVAHRLAQRRVMVRRLSSVEALGRVDVVCTDKTGTMTKGRLQLSVVADVDQDATLAEQLPAMLSHVLFTAALASPHPDAQGARAHPTDAAVVQGAIAAGLREQSDFRREAELAFDPVRSFSVSVARGRLCLKGAPEAVLARCGFVFREGERRLLDERERAVLVTRARLLAGRGLRVLMVAEGTGDQPLADPRNLTALGFVGINDPLRPRVQEAVRRCHEAGVRVLMITGDHPETARAIAQEAGLLKGQEEVLNAAEIADLQNGDLDRRLKHAAVIARATPLDKLRVIESLRRQGHVVSMTGDGVNDAPALRLADMGVAMGESGTEVARQTADVVITNDDFSALVEGFVEGRSFWRNMRRSLGLLLGGNLGELGLVVGASLLGTGMPLTVGQILAVNAITDILPALAVILQQPEHHDLTRLRREGTTALDAPLFKEVLRRGLATALPSLTAYLVALGRGSLPQARAVAFASIVLTQLAQTLMVGRAEGHLTRPVLGAVGGSLGVLLAAFSLPPLRRFLNLVIPSPVNLLLMGGSALTALLVNRVLGMVSGGTPMPHP